MNPIGLLLLAAAFGLAIVVGALLRRWSAGMAAPVDWVAGLLRLPAGYLATVHGVVERDSGASRMHALAAGGLLAALIISFPLHLTGWLRGPLALLVLVGVAVSLLGATLAVRRRRGDRVPRLKPSRFAATPYVACAVLAILALAAALRLGGAGDVAFLALAIAGGPVFTLVLVSAYRGAFRHAVAGALHLVVHPRPARVEGRRDAALQSLDLSAPRLGAGRMGDFAWNRLASFDACVQCGRCEAVCPAYGAGQLLNPKALIADLSAGIGRPGAAALEIVPPEAVWACTTCRACVHECPMLIEHVDAVVSMRRFAVMEEGALPHHAANVLASLRETDTQGGQDTATRLDWAVDLKLPVLEPGGACDVLLWLGENAYDIRHQRTLRALVQLLRRAEVDFAVLGAAELDTGDIARRLGDEAAFADLAGRNVATLSTVAFGRIVAADPHAYNVLKNEYPAFGGSYTVLHHSELLADLVAAGRLAPLQRRLEGRVTYHDPCYLSRYNGETRSSRLLLDAVGVDFVEMERSGQRSHCCGGGGGAPLAVVPGRRQISETRMGHVRAVAADTVVVGCPQCAQMLESVPGSRPAVADLAELLLACVETAPR